MVRGRGVYKITIGDRILYVGQSVNLKARLARHKRELRNGIHRNAHLQNVANKYGVDAFDFSIIEESDGDLTPLEMHYIRELMPECNKNMPSEDDTWERSEECRAAMSKRMKGRKLPATAYENSRKYWSGRHLSEETKRKISEKNTGRKRTMSEDERRMRSKVMKEYYRANIDEKKAALMRLMSESNCFVVELEEGATKKDVNALRMRCRRAAQEFGKTARVKMTDDPKKFMVMLDE